MKHYLLLILFFIASSWLVNAQTYCTPTAPAEKGPHYGVLSGYIKVNGAKVFDFDQTVITNQFHCNLFDDESKVISIYPNDEIIIGINGSDPHSKWTDAVAFFDWNANGNWDDEGEENILYKGSEVALVNSEYIIHVPATIGNEFAFRLAMGEGTAHGNPAFTACQGPKRGTIHTFKVAKGVDIEERTITLEASPVEGGQVSGGGTHMGEIACVAEANKGYHFVNWTNKATSEVISTKTSFFDNTPGDKTYIANFEANPPKTQYGTVANSFSTINQQNRYLKKITTIDSENQTSVVLDATTINTLPVLNYQTTSIDNSLINITENPIYVTAGTTNLDITFYGFEGTINTYTPQLNWTQQAVFVDWNKNFEFSDEGELYSTEGQSMPNPDFIAENGFTRTITIPAEIEKGDYRMRVIYNENQTDWAPTIMDEEGNASLNCGVAYDLLLRVIEPAAKRTITATANPTEGGTISISNTEANTEDVTLIATANEGYEFVNWAYGETIVSTNATYTSVYNSENVIDSAFVANFSVILTPRTITATANPTEGGTISISNTEANTEDVTLIATANEGYEFVNWAYGETIVSTNATYTSVYNSENVIDSAFVANFSVILTPRTITATANPAEGGTISISNTEANIEDVTLIATANEGYEFVNWVYGETIVSTNATYTSVYNSENVADSAFVANFSVILTPRTITATANPAEGGTISISNTEANTEDVTLIAAANEGYEFVNWMLNGTIVASETTLNITYDSENAVDAEYIANFEVTTTVLEYCTPTAPAETGPHYGVLSGYIKVNGAKVLDFDQTGMKNGFYCDLFNDASKLIVINPNDEIIIGINGSDPHSKWTDAVAFFDWNANGNWDDESEENILYKGSEVALVNSEYTIHVPATIGNEFAFRLAMGEGTAHGNTAFTACQGPKRGSIHTFKVAKGVDIEERTITLEASPVEGGQVSGGGTHIGAIACVAEANKGYHFVNWTNKSTSEVVSTKTSFFDNTPGDKTYVANFEANPPKTQYGTVANSFSTINQQNRYLQSVTSIDSENQSSTAFNVTSVNDLPVIDYSTTSTDNALIDKTENPILVTVGATSVEVTFYGWNSTVNSYTSQLNWTQQAVFVDWNKNFDFTDEGELYSTEGQSMPNPDFINANGFKRTIAIPTEIEKGDYRMRIIYHENQTDWAPTIINDEGNATLNSGVAYDLILRVADPVGINDNYSSKLKVSANETSITICGAELGTLVNVVTPTGQVIYNGYATDNMIIKTSVKGIIIVKSGDKVVKLVK